METGVGTMFLIFFLANNLCFRQGGARSSAQAKPPAARRILAVSAKIATFSDHF